MNRRTQRHYVQARISPELYTQVAVELVLSGESFQGLLTKLLEEWARKRARLARIRARSISG